MNILILEDRGSVAYYMKEALVDLGHVVLVAYNVNDAQSHWNRRDDVPVDCMIIDLNMDTTGLNDEQKQKSKGGLLTAWIWLTERVFPEERGMRRRVIIYSDYLADLEKYAPAEELVGMRLVAKRASSKPVEQVLNHVSDIARQLKGGMG